jgi:hypothetical protein
LKILGLDISTRTGWSLFESGRLVDFGLIEKSKPHFTDYGEYPYNFVEIAEDVAEQIFRLVLDKKPDKIVVEEVNKPGRFGSRFSQKILDSIHCLTLLKLKLLIPNDSIAYINTSDWRKKLNLSVIETKKKAKPFLKELANLKKQYLSADKSDKKDIKLKIDTLKNDLKQRCILHNIDKKSISVAHVNLVYGLNLKKGDNDISDAVCQIEAFLRGVHVISNTDIF